MDSYRRANGVRRRLGARNILRKATKYAIITATLVGLAYAGDRCNASDKIDKCISKSREGIEYIVDKI